MWHCLKIAYISVLTAALLYYFYPQLHDLFTNRHKNMLSYLCIFVCRANFQTYN